MDQLKTRIRGSGQDGGVGRNTASSHNQKKDNNQFGNNKQPEVPENQTALNSDDQGVKETFIQTDKRDKDGQPGWRGHMARQ